MDVTDIRPIQNYVIIDEEERPSETAGGIYLAGDAQEDCTSGVVRATGPGYKGRERPMQVEEGDRVLFHSGSGRDIPGASETVRMVRQTNIYAKIDGAVAQGAYQSST